MTRTLFVKRKAQTGAALVAVLWVIVLAGVILLSVNRSAMVHASLAQNELARVQARWLARAGVEQALAILADDIEPQDSPLDYWYEDALSFEQVELTTGVFSVIAPDERTEGVNATRYGLTDLSGRINLSTASEQALRRLPDITDEQVQAILDWRDGDSNTRAGGAEQGYYQQLDFPYDPANKPFASIRELRLVRGIDDETFFGEDANLNYILDPNENDGDVSQPQDIADGELELGLAGLGAVHSYENNTDPYGATRTNLNNVQWQTLQQTFYFSQALAYGVIDHRNNNEFEDIFDLLDVRPLAKGAPAQEGEISQVNIEWLAQNYDSFTVNDDNDRLPARINLNTAPIEVLMTLPRITDDQARQIFDYRLSPQGPITGYDQLINAGIIDDDLFELLAEHITLRSHVFEVNAVGVANNGVKYNITAVIDRGQNPPRIIYQHYQE